MRCIGQSGYHIKNCVSNLLNIAIKYCNLHNDVVNYLWKMTTEMRSLGVLLSKLTKSHLQLDYKEAIYDMESS